MAALKNVTVVPFSEGLQTPGRFGWSKCGALWLCIGYLDIFALVMNRYHPEHDGI
jgi:hypothetical protein